MGTFSLGTHVGKPYSRAANGPRKLTAELGSIEATHARARDAKTKSVYREIHETNAAAMRLYNRVATKPDLVVYTNFFETVREPYRAHPDFRTISIASSSDCS